jgi:hypothetical protein
MRTAVTICVVHFGHLGNFGTAGCDSALSADAVTLEKMSKRRPPSALIRFRRGSKLVGGIAAVFGANEG